MAAVQFDRLCLAQVRWLGLVIIAALLILSGCGGDEEGNASSSSSSSGSSSSTSSSSSSGDLPDPAKLYLDLGCLACHGADGQQKSQPILFENYTLQTLIAKIDRDMPIVNPDSCGAECARVLGEYLWAMRPVVSCTSGEKVLPRRLRLLTKFEYINTLNDLFGFAEGARLAGSVGTDTEVRGFDNNALANAVTIPRIEGYWTASAATAEAANLSSRLNACPSQMIADCFVTRFGRDAFRRPLTDEEKSDYVDLFGKGMDSEAGARLVVQAMLISPHFLYRTELGQNGRLTQYEVANLLAYTFWGSMPDEALFDSAAGNSLSTTTQIQQAVDRMLASNKAQKQFIHFGRQWLDLDPVVGIDRNIQLFPDFDYAVASSMDTELEFFLREVMLQDGYSMADFLSADFTFVDLALADFYGMAGVTTLPMQRVTVNNNRGGILSMGALLTRNAKFDESHPIKRGLLVRRNLLCQEFGTPPPNIGEVEPFDSSKPTRERFAAHSSNANCASCHQFIDEIGFAFENYDAVGHYRTEEAGGAAVDASGTIAGLARMTDGDRHSFRNLQELAGILATEGFVPTSACLVEQFQRLMDGVAEPDSCSRANTVARWQPSANSIRDLWVEMVASQTFLQRQ